ncbi:hypothetical protein HRbin29_01779 [bacterium HR29]|jgi:hypothetical protein|nr:hypothetical protein HRbin29_01779 [bacterium HR29]
MAGTLDGFRRFLLEFEPSGEPVLTATLDLRQAAAGGPPPARTVAKEALAAAIAEFAGEDERRAEPFRAERERLEAAIDAALADGALGLVYVAVPGEGVRDELQLPLPLRNDVRIAPVPWLWELERYRFLLDRPVTVATVDLHTLHVFRLRHGQIEASGGVDWSQHPLMKRHGRAATEGRGSIGSAAGGWHSKNKLEAIVEAHRAMFSKEAGRELANYLGGDTVLIVAGADEARSELLQTLEPAVRSRAVELPGNPTHHEPDARQLRELAAEHAAALAQREAAAALAEWRESGRFVAGPEAVAQAIAEGRLAGLLLHDDGAGHWGTAADARRVPPLGDADRLHELLRGALRTGADVRFASDPSLVEEGCAAGVLRW